MEWKIYYQDGSTFSSDDGDVSEAPAWGVEVIVEPNELVGRELHVRTDYYLYLKDRWESVDFIGLIDFLANELGILKIGRIMNRVDYQKILNIAINDSDFPKKSGWLQDEQAKKDATL